MAAGCHCKCNVKDHNNWVVTVRNGNYSAFESPKNGFHYSDYSSVKCTKCGMIWRTKANYVVDLPDEA